MVNLYLAGKLVTVCLTKVKAADGACCTMDGEAALARLAIPFKTIRQNADLCTFDKDFLGKIGV